MKKNCLKCNKIFNIKPFALKRGNGTRGKYCGMECRKFAYKLYVPSIATREKISLKLKGVRSGVFGKHWKLSDKTKKKMSKNKIGLPNENWIGDKNPNWKGGVSKKNKKERQLVMETLEYKNWRRFVFERDKYTCVMCGDDKGGNLEADHIIPVSINIKLIFETSNGRTLCKKCHQKITVEFNKKNWSNQFINMKNETDEKEVKCETCGQGLGRTEKYGRNLCEKCEEKLIEG